MRRTPQRKDYFEKWRRAHGKPPRAEYLESVRKPGYCPSCKTTKPVTEFNKATSRPRGYAGVCRDCQKAKYKDWVNRLSPADREVIRQRNNAATQRYKRNPENIMKKAAHAMVGAAIKAGRLESKPCRECGNPRTHAHHADYTKPLEVVWLCPLHHKKIHSTQPS